VPTG